MSKWERFKLSWWIMLRIDTATLGMLIEQNPTWKENENKSQYIKRIVNEYLQ